MSTFQYQTTAGGAWTTESNRVRFTITDTLYFPLQLEVTIADPLNSLQSTYPYYRRVRIVEDSTSRVIFYGKIEDVAPKLDSEYGQVLVIIARDNLNELSKRLTDTNYTFAGVTRAAVIQQLVTDHSYGTNITTSDTQKFVASPITEAAGVLDTNFDGSGMNALRAIYELAQEDPIDASRTGFGHCFYLDHEFSGNTPQPDLHYFARGARPATPASTYGLTVQYNGTEANQVRAMLPDYEFHNEGKELVTRVRIEYVNSTGATSTLTVMLINHGAVTGGPFTVGETITWNAGVDSATVQYVGSSYLVVSAQTQTANLPGSVVTGGSSAATATVNATTASPPGVLREAIQQDSEIVLRDYHVEHLTEARTRAAQILYQGGDTIQRGVMQVVRWPYYTITGTHTGANNAASLTDAAASFINYGVRVGDVIDNTTDGSSTTITAVTATTVTGVLAGGTDNDWDTGDAWRIRVIVRTGHAIRVINSNLSINEDMLVTKITFDEGPDIGYARIETVTNATTRGIGGPVSGIEFISRDTERALWQSIASAGGLPSTSQLVNIDFVFTTPAYNQIAWAGGNAIYSDGTSETINTTGSPFTIPTDAVFYIFKIKGTPTLQITRNFSGVVDPTTGQGPVTGMNNALIAICKRNSSTGEDAYVVSMNNGSPVIATGTLIANELSAVSANMGLLTAGAIRLPSGVTNTVDTTGFTGFTLNGDRIAGYNAGTLQVEIRSNDGRFYSGDGNISIINARMDINNPNATNFENFRLMNSSSGAGTGETTMSQLAANLQIVIKTGGLVLQAASVSGTALVDFVTTGLRVSGSGIQMSGSAWSTPGVGELVHVLVISPESAGTGQVGTASLYFGDIRSENFHVFPTGAGAGNTGETRYLELAANGSNYVGFKASDSLSGNQIWTLPTADGRANAPLITDGAGILSWSNYPLTVLRKTADETVTNDTIQNDDDIALAVGTNQLWHFQIHAILSSPSADDFKFDFTVPAGTTIVGTLHHEADGTTPEIEDFTESGLSAVQPSGSNQHLLFAGLIDTAGTSGTVQWRWAKVADADPANAIMRAGTVMLAWRID